MWDAKRGHRAKMSIFRKCKNYAHKQINMPFQCIVFFSSSSHLKVNSLESAVAEHLDHLHYMNDILSLNVAPLNEILRDHLLNRLFLPLYIHSLFETSLEARKDAETPRVSSKIALFLLSQVRLSILYMYVIHACTGTLAITLGMKS